MDHAVSRRRPRLAQGVIDEMRRRIDSGALPVGSQLPTEPQLEIQFGVSRTVVREAIAELRAAGFVTPIQGKGIFVAEQSRTSAVDLTPGEIQSIPQTLEMLEFRMAVETEAAAIAAYRRSAEQENAIRAAHLDMHGRVEKQQPTSEADFALHLAIAEATNNPRFREFLTMIGKRLIPRAALRPDDSESDQAAYIALLDKEHDAIVVAISEGDEEGARQAMRSHLRGAQLRYRTLLREVRQSVR